MSKKSATKRSALQRLSENMDSIISNSEAKRRKPNQTKCNKLKLKPDPASLFKRFRMHGANCENEHHGEDNGISSNLTPGMLKKPINQKPRAALKTWTPPLKTNRNTEQLFDRLQNPERNIGIFNKNKLEIKKRKPTSETVTSSAYKEELGKSEKSDMIYLESSEEVEEIKIDKAKRQLDDVTSTNNDRFSNNFNKGDQNDFQVYTENLENKLGNSKFNIAIEINQNSPDAALNKTEESHVKVKEQPSPGYTTKKVDEIGEKDKCKKKLISNLETELNFIFNDNNLKTKTDFEKMSVQMQESKTENSKSPVNKKTNDNSNEDIFLSHQPAYDVNENSSIAANEERFDFENKISNQDENLEQKNVETDDDDLKDSDKDEQFYDVTDETIFSQKIQASKNCKLNSESVMNEENTFKIDQSQDCEQKNIFEMNDCNTKVREIKFKDDNFQKKVDNNEDLYYTCKTEHNYDVDEYINLSIDRSLMEENDEINEEDKIIQDDKFSITENNINEEETKDIEVNLVSEEKCENDKPEDKQNGSRKNLVETKNFADDIADDKISTSFNIICETTDKNSIIHQVEIIDGNVPQKADNIYEKIVTNDTDENIPSLSIKTVEENETVDENVDKSFNIDTDNLSEFPQIVTELQDISEEIVIEDKASKVKEPFDNDNREINEANMKENVSSQNSNETLTDSKLEGSQIISLESSNNSQENNFETSNYSNEDHFIQSDCKNIEKKEKYDDLIECSDDFFNIPMSEVIRIENEYTETKMKNLSKQTTDKNNQMLNTNNNVGANKVFQQNSLTTNKNTSQNHRFPAQLQLKLGWVQKMNEEKQKLRSIIQEINKLNNMVLQARKELWPHQFDNN